ncbi:flagellar basal body rod C-terminal domain-containing protein [Aurantivibrio plasticivorans]
MISSVINTGLQGLQSSSREIVKSADDIVKAGTTERDNSNISDIAEPIVNMAIEQQVFDASAKIVKVGDEMLGTLMDIKA